LIYKNEKSRFSEITIVILKKQDYREFMKCTAGLCHKELCRKILAKILFLQLAVSTSSITQRSFDFSKNATIGEDRSKDQCD